eukprot:g23509.t1
MLSIRRKASQGAVRALAGQISLETRFLAKKLRYRAELYLMSRDRWPRYLEREELVRNLKQEAKVTKLHAKNSWNAWRADLLRASKARLEQQLGLFKDDLAQIEALEQKLLDFSRKVSLINDPKLIKLRAQIQEHVNLISEHVLEHELLTRRKASVQERLSELKAREDALAEQKQQLAARYKQKRTEKLQSARSEVLTGAFKSAAGYKSCGVFRDENGGGAFECEFQQIPGLRVTSRWNQDQALTELSTEWAPVQQCAFDDAQEDRKVVLRIFKSDEFQRKLNTAKQSGRVDSLTEVMFYLGRLGEMLKDLQAARGIANLTPINLNDSEDKSMPEFHLSVANFAKGQQISLRIQLTAEYPFANLLAPPQKLNGLSVSPISLVRVPADVTEVRVRTAVQDSQGFAWRRLQEVRTVFRERHCEQKKIHLQFQMNLVTAIKCCISQGLKLHVWFVQNSESLYKAQFGGSAALLHLSEWLNQMVFCQLSCSELNGLAWFVTGAGSDLVWQVDA